METKIELSSPFPIPRRNVREFSAAGLLALRHPSDTFPCISTVANVFSQHLQLRGQRWFCTKLPY